MIRVVLATTVALLLGFSPSEAQVSTMGTTAMGLPTVPGAIVTSPLNSPGPFSATTEPGVPDTTLAPVPLASDPTTPGTVVVCATPSTSPMPVPATPIVSSIGPSASGIGAPLLPVTGQTGSSIGTIPQRHRRERGRRSHAARRREGSRQALRPCRSRSRKCRPVSRPARSWRTPAPPAVPASIRMPPSCRARTARPARKASR